MTLACEIEEIKKLTNSSSGEDVAKAYLDYTEWKNKTSDASIYQFGLPQDKAFVKKISGIRDKPENDIWENAVRAKADKYLEDSKEEKKHKKRRDLIEDAMRLLKNFIESNKATTATYTLLAKAYLLRSRIVRPKGLTIPEKKKKAIENGIKYAGDALAKDASYTDALRVKAQLYLELDRLRGISEADTDKLRSALEGVLLNISSFEGINDVKIAIRYSELTNDKSYIEAIINSSVPDIELEKAKAYKLLGKETELTEVFKAHIEKLEEEAFSNPMWDETMNLLKDLWKENRKNKNFECWKELSLAAWDACNSIEKNMQSPLHIRWYWARMRDLYDLAFLATDDPDKKAEIADSLKSRPALRWNAIEETAKTLQSKKLGELIKAYETTLSGGYLKQIPKHKQTGQSITSERSVANIPESWTVIHFYLNQLEKKGYTIIADSQDPKSWKIKDFEYTELFKAYMEWQTNYTRHKEDATDYLVKLCEAIGSTMSFLFDNSIPANSNVLFIPHDFLHRLPLHGAINNEGKVFLETHASSYLPAWSYAQPKSGNKVSGNWLLKNWDDKDDFKGISRYFEPNIIDEAAADDLEEITRKAPQLLVILCHGRADAVNPFNAKLKLKDNGISHLGLSQLPKELDGSKIILGACETDLMPTLTDVLDEHLSVSVAFLGLGASEILGTMWEVYPFDVEEVIKEYCEKLSETQMATIQSWQKKIIANQNHESVDLYKSLSFRVIGHPW